MKRTERGFIDFVYDCNYVALITTWHDNTPFTIATNYSEANPTSSCPRYSRKHKSILHWKFLRLFQITASQWEGLMSETSKNSRTEWESVVQQIEVSNIHADAGYCCGEWLEEFSAFEFKITSSLYLNQEEIALTYASNASSSSRQHPGPQWSHQS